jgi:hypothetical protein
MGIRQQAPSEKIASKPIHPKNGRHITPQHRALTPRHMREGIQNIIPPKQPRMRGIQNPTKPPIIPPIITPPIAIKPQKIKIIAQIISPIPAKIISMVAIIYKGIPGKKAATQKYNGINIAPTIAPTPPKHTPPTAPSIIDNPAPPIQQAEVIPKQIDGIIHTQEPTNPQTPSRSPNSISIID